MTQEEPYNEKDEYLPHKPSEENGLVEDLDPESHNPEYLLEEQEDDREDDFTFQLDFGYFQYQTQFGDDW